MFWKISGSGCDLLGGNIQMDNREQVFNLITSAPVFEKRFVWLKILQSLSHQ